MSAISSIPPVSFPSPQPLTPISTEMDSENTESEFVDPPSPAEKSSSVSISDEGKEKLAGEQKNADIDATNLPERIKKYLRSIRELQEKIKEKIQELQAAMNDRSLSEKERETKVNKIQLELSVLSSTLTSITNDLNKTEVEMKLQAPDLKLINSLMVPK